MASSLRFALRRLGHQQGVRSRHRLRLGGAPLVAVRTFNPHLLNEAALRVKALGENSIYVNYVEEAPVAPGLTELEPSKESLQLLGQAMQEMEKKGINAIPVWQLGDSPGKLISMAAKELGVDTVMIGTTGRIGLIIVTTLFWRACQAKPRADCDYLSVWVVFWGKVIIMARRGRERKNLLLKFRKKWRRSNHKKERTRFRLMLPSQASGGPTQVQPED